MQAFLNGFKASIGPKLAYFENFEVDSNLEQKDSKRNIVAIKWYRQKIERDLEAKCLEVIELLESITHEEGRNAEIDIFFLKMRADYLRYLCEFTTNDK